MSSIIGKTKGGVDSTQDSLAHFHDENLAVGGQMFLGDGRETGLFVWQTGIGVRSPADLYHRIDSDAASVVRTVTIPDASGSFVLGAGEGVTDAPAFKAALGETSVTLTADFSTDQDTAQPVTGFSLAVEVNSTYQFRAFLKVKSADNDRGVRPTLTGPAGTISSVTAIARIDGTELVMRALDTSADFGGTNGTDLEELMVIEGIITTNGTAPASEFGLSIHSETSGTLVTAMTGSSLILTKV